MDKLRCSWNQTAKAAKDKIGTDGYRNTVQTFVQTWQPFHTWQAAPLPGNGNEAGSVHHVGPGDV